MIGDWLKSIANADTADWVTVATYLVAALLCGKATGAAILRREWREAMFWRACAALMVVFAINELLDLQTLLTIAVRAHAVAYGWYGSHRAVQYAFVLGLCAAAGIAGIVLLWITRRAHPGVRLAVIGLGFIGLFILLRASSFHRVDELLGRGTAFFNWGSIQEVAGIAVVAGAALLYRRQR